MRISETTLKDGIELSGRRGFTTDQCIPGTNWLEPQENDEKAEDGSKKLHFSELRIIVSRINY